jgi:hypothetical protein
MEDKKITGLFKEPLIIKRRLQKMQLKKKEMRVSMLTFIG